MTTNTLEMQDLTNLKIAYTAARFDLKLPIKQAMSYNDWSVFADYMLAEGFTAYGRLILQELQTHRTAEYPEAVGSFCLAASLVYFYLWVLDDVGEYDHATKANALARVYRVTNGRVYWGINARRVGLEGAIDSPEYLNGTAPIEEYPDIHRKGFIHKATGELYRAISYRQRAKSLRGLVYTDLARALKFVSAFRL